ncbi:hypothetical protein [Celeribacter sp.]|uniref:hypothetical protein n=1 Tax=Celeribacter sp. TaxID=1890673 RepID=UPI003A8FA7A7
MTHKRLTALYASAKECLAKLMFTNTLRIPLSAVDPDLITISDEYLAHLNEGRINIQVLPSIWRFSAVYRLHLDTSCPSPCLVLVPTPKNVKMTKAYWGVLMAILLFGLILVAPSEDLSRLKIVSAIAAILVFQGLFAHFEQKKLPQQIKSALEGAADRNTSR